MLGAMLGDFIGSPYERNNCKREDFDLFGNRNTITDDSILTIATMEVLMGRGDYEDKYREWAGRYPGAGYGPMFRTWMGSRQPGPYGSLGNGSAMRVSPVGFFGKELSWVLNEAKRSAEVTHNHPEAIQGAQAVAGSIFLLCGGASKSEVKQWLESEIGYLLDRTLDEIRPGYRFDATCKGSVPEALTAFLESTNHEEAIRKAVSLGGDSDTIACMAGALAEAEYGPVPVDLTGPLWRTLPDDMREVITSFYRVVEGELFVAGPP